MSLSITLPPAISAALSPYTTPAQKQEAYTFLESVKQSAASEETWRSCLAIFCASAGGASGDTNGVGPECRLYALQVVDEALNTSFGQVSNQQLLVDTVRQELLEYLARVYMSGAVEETNYIKNKLAQTLFYLFMRSYTTSFPDFFTVFISQIRTPASPSTNGTSLSPLPTPPDEQQRPLNNRITDLLLRILHEISMELSDAILRGNKSSERLAIESELRDGVRAKDAPLIAKTLWEIVAECFQILSSGTPNPKIEEMLEMSVRVVGDYVAWIDINLMVTPSTISLLHNCIFPPFATPSNPVYSIRTATADALIETVSKGMPGGDKMELISALRLPELLTSLASIGRENGEEEGEELLEKFREKLGKLLSGVGKEIFSILDDQKLQGQTKQKAYEIMNSLSSVLLTFLGDKRDETCIAVVPFALGVLGVYKREKGSANNDGKQVFLTQLLGQVVKKMEYGEDLEWSLEGEDGDDEDLTRFQDLRKGLKQMFDGIATIDGNLFGSTVYGLVTSVLELLQSNPSSVTWQRAELAIYVLYIYGEATKAATGQAGFVMIPEHILKQQQSRPKTQNSQQNLPEIDHSQYPLSPLGEMVFRAIKSNVVAFPHSAVSLQFFECVVRYHEFFKLSPDCIADVLPSFMDERGLHQPDIKVRCRVYYLFNRFIFNSKSIIQSQVSGQLISDILSRMEDVMIIKSELPQTDNPQEDILSKAARTASPFDSQLYLFETMGTLISILNQIPDQQVALLRAGLSPLLAGLESNVRTSVSSVADVLAILQLHHVIMAIGNVAKGFPDVSPRNLEPTGLWVHVFKEATERILAVLKVMSGISVIREASRFAFNRIVTTAGSSVLPLVPTLIDCLINQVTLTELADFMSFLGNLIHKYKAHIFGVLDNLILPLFQRVVFFLNQPITGTDDKMQHSELRRAHFNLMNMIINSHLHEVFVSPTNRPMFEETLKTTIQFIQINSLPSDQKQGLLVLRNFTIIWVEAISPEAEASAKVTQKFNNTKSIPTSTPIPGLQNFLYEHAVPMAVGLTRRAETDFTDVATYEVVGEIYFFLKNLQLKRGDEFIAALANQILPAQGFTPEQAQVFITNLMIDIKDYKKFKTYYSEFCRATKPSYRSQFQ